VFKLAPGGGGRGRERERGILNGHFKLSICQKIIKYIIIKIASYCLLEGVGIKYLLDSIIY